MRRLLFPTIVALGLVMVGSSGASADDPKPAPTVSAKSTPGKKLCKVVDERLDEISGLVATKDGFIVVNDGTDVEDKAREQVFFLDRECKVTKPVPFSGAGPTDPEDIVLAPDGKTLWIADIGNNGVRQTPADPRPTVALWSMPADGSKKPVLFRVSYPQNDSHDAEALIFNGDGTPLIVTREIGKPAGVYQPTAALKSDATTQLKRVGEITVTATETAGNAVARLGNKTITGGAITQGATKVVLRTYTDALEWDVAGGDVLAALKKEPRTTGLPNEALGESISYSPDGKLFYTISDMSGDEKAANNIREYTPATTVAVKSEKSGKSGTSDSWYSNLTIDDVTYMVGGVGLLGLLLVGAGIFGIMRFRRTPQGYTGDDADLPGGLNTDDPETELIGVGGAPQRGAAAYSAGRPAGGPVYGAQSGPPPGGPQRGNGSPPAAGPQYGRPAGQQPRGPQQAPPRGPQQTPPRGPQQAPARGPQQAPARGGPQQAPPRGPQPGRGPQQPPPARGPQQQPPRGPQQAPRGPQPAPGRGGPQQPPARGPQPAPGRGGPQKQPPPGRGPQQQQPRGPQGQQAPRGPQGQQPPRGPQGQGPQGQPPRGPKGQQAPRSPGVYGGGGRPPAPDDRQ